MRPSNKSAEAAYDEPASARVKHNSGTDESMPSPRSSNVRAQWCELLEDMETVQRALDAFLAADYVRSQLLLSSIADSQTSLYGSLGMGILLLMKSLLTFAPEDVSQSRSSFDDAIMIAGKIKRALGAETVYSRLGRIFARRGKSVPEAPRFDPHSQSATISQQALSEHVQRHAELVTAECYLARAILGVLTDSTGAWLLLMKEALNIRAAYIIYHESFARLSTANKDLLPDAQHFESGILLGCGVINLIFSLLPPRIFSFFTYIGYTGNLAVGLSQLRTSCSFRKGLRSVWAEMAICFYYFALTGPLAVRPSEAEETTDLALLDSDVERRSLVDVDQAIDFVSEVIWKRVQDCPTCPIFRYFQARYFVLNSRIGAARIVLEYSVQTGLSSAWPELVQSGLWELVTTCMLQLDWFRCLELTKILVAQGRWSVSFALFLQAVFLRALQKVPDADTTQTILELFRQVPTRMTRIAGRRIPVEKYAAQRADESLRSGKLPFHPEYELMLVWDVFIRMKPSDLDKVEADLKSAESSNDALTLSQSGMIKLCNASIMRSRRQYAEAIHLIEEIFATYGHANRPQHEPGDSYIIPVAHAERSQVALEMRDLETAEKHYASSAGYQKKYILQRSMHLRHVKIRGEIDRVSAGL